MCKSLTGLPANHFTWLPVHDPDAPRKRSRHGRLHTDGVLQLLFFGTGVPLHGLDTLVAAVAQAPNVKLTLVGGTDDHRRLAKQMLGTRVVIGPSFVDSQRLREAD